MGLNKQMDQKTYATLLADGTLRVKCDESNPEAKKREIEKSDGTKQIKFDLVYLSLSGLITNLEIEDGTFGEQLRLTITDDGDSTIVTTGASSNFADDLMKKLPNVDFLQAVEFKPFSFTNDKGKPQKGITLVQGDNKLPNFFFDPEAKKSINEFPELAENYADFKKKDWKKHFEGVNQFLIDYTLNVVVPKLPSLVTDDEVSF